MFLNKSSFADELSLKRYFPSQNVPIPTQLKLIEFYFRLTLSMRGKRYLLVSEH